MATIIHKYKAIKFIGRVFAFIATMLFGSLWASFAFWNGYIRLNMGVVIIVLLMLVGMLILSLRNELVAGLLFLLPVIGMGFICYYSIYDYGAWLLFGLPYLIASILFIVSWLLSHKRTVIPK